MRSDEGLEKFFLHPAVNESMVARTYVKRTQKVETCRAVRAVVMRLWCVVPRTIHAAAEGVGLLMELQVVFKMLLDLKSLVTARVRAAKGPLFRVRPLVPREQCTVHEALTTTLKLADPGLLTCVDPVMTIETPA